MNTMDSHHPVVLDHVMSTLNALFYYVDTGISLVNRSYLVFQQMSCSDLCIALGTQQFVGEVTPTPTFELCVGWIDTTTMTLGGTDNAAGLAKYINGRLTISCTF